jgi:hypothetical protein
MNEQDPSQPAGPTAPRTSSLPHVALYVNGEPYAGTWTYEEQDGLLMAVFDPPLAAIDRLSLQLRPRTPGPPQPPTDA